MHMHCVFYRHPLHLTKTINFLMEVEKLPSNLKNDLELLLKKGGDQECRTVSSVPSKTMLARVQRNLFAASLRDWHLWDWCVNVCCRLGIILVL